MIVGGVILQKNVLMEPLKGHWKEDACCGLIKVAQVCFFFLKKNIEFWYLIHQLIAIGMLFFAYFFSALAFILLLVDIFSILYGDIQNAMSETDERVRESWWRNQRSGKAWVSFSFVLNFPLLIFFFNSKFSLRKSS